ncbi:MAG: sensor histidine kinase [Planctomycetota bacterium]|jgi:signal transduction histidine kinase
MYRRIIILSVIILAALCGLVWLGYHSIQIWAQGMEGTRIGEFADVAEQIRQDVKYKLDEFMQTEQNRPYTDYKYYFVPEDVAPGQIDRGTMPVVRSPLAGKLEHGLAFYNFQIEPDGNVFTPNANLDELQATTNLGDNVELYNQVLLNESNVKDNLLPRISGAEPNFVESSIGQKRDIQRETLEEKLKGVAKEVQQQKMPSKGKKLPSDRTESFVIESLQKQEQKPQIIRQSRALVASNTAQSLQEVAQEQEALQQRLRRNEQQPALEQQAEYEEEFMELSIAESDKETSQSRQQPESRRRRSFGEVQQQQPAQVGQTTDLYEQQIETPQGSQNDTVEIRIEPFEPMVVPGKDATESIFGGQVFMLRRVQIEDKQFHQGFQLNEKRLIEEIEESAQRFVHIREGMGFELGRAYSEKAVYTAILDFGFGHLFLNLLEIDPDRMVKRISELKGWYFSIITVVFLAVTLALAGLWYNARAQVKLAQKKDDFISAVSHELRTPLTSIRMYSEMLEKNWVKSQDKVTEYYRNMRQESERLSRLIENVLDFSRIQRGRKKYTFNAGDINKSVEDVVEMMRPYAAQRGFSIKTEFGRFEQSAFDRDAVTQIVVNLLDNAIKYARNAKDRTITVRTGSNDKFILIEIEDHGPGVPHRQRTKIFEEFYRSGAEATRETAGTGLGLALVRKFAQAHNGFVEIINAKPTGAIFRVALAARM